MGRGRGASAQVWTRRPGRRQHHQQCPCPPAWLYLFCSTYQTFLANCQLTQKPFLCTLLADEAYAFTSKTAQHKYEYPFPKLFILGILAGGAVSHSWALVGLLLCELASLTSVMRQPCLLSQ